MEIIGVSEGVLKFLRAHIVTRAFKPGQKLNEIELSRSLGISRAPLREAFRILEREHLVMSVPRKGCVVTGLSIKDCRDIYGVRAMIELTAVDLLESQNIRELPRVAEALEKTFRLKSPEDDDAPSKFEYLRAIADFHVTLVEAAGNLRMNQLYIAIFPSLARYQALYTYIPGLMDESKKEHEGVLRFVKKGNYPKAKDLLKSHIEKFPGLIADKLETIENGK